MQEQAESEGAATAARELMAKQETEKMELASLAAQRKSDLENALEQKRALALKSVSMSSISHAFNIECMPLCYPLWS